MLSVNTTSVRSFCFHFSLPIQSQGFMFLPTRFRLFLLFGEFLLELSNTCWCSFPLLCYTAFQIYSEVLIFFFFCVASFPAFKFVGFVFAIFSIQDPFTGSGSLKLNAALSLLLWHCSSLQLQCCISIVEGCALFSLERVLTVQHWVCANVIVNFNVCYCSCCMCTLSVEHVHTFG